MPTHAHRLEHRDPDDVGGRLDIRTTQIRVATYGGAARSFDLGVFTYERFERRHLQGARPNVVATFDSRRGPKPDYRVLISSAPDGLVCEVRAIRGTFSRQGEAYTQPRMVACAFKRGWLDPDPDNHIRWRVMTRSADGRDLAPDDGGWYKH